MHIVPLKRSNQGRDFTFFNTPFHLSTCQHRPVYIIVALFWVSLSYLVSLLVHQGVIIYMLIVFVELINYRESIWNFKLLYILIAYSLNMLEESSKGILMGHNNNLFSTRHFPEDLILPKRGNTLKCILKGLHRGQMFPWHMLVLSVVAWVPIIVHGQSRRTVWVALPPLVQVLFRDCGTRGLLLEALEGSIVLLVESVILVMGNPVAVELICDRMVGPNCPLQHWSVSVVEGVAVLLQNFTGLVSLWDAERS